MLLPTLLVCLIFLSAGGIGSLFLRKQRRRVKDSGLYAVNCLAIGLGFLSLSTLALGLAGLWTQWPAWIFIGVIFIAVAAVELTPEKNRKWHQLQLTAKPFAPCSKIEIALICALAALALLVFVRAFTPVLNYDALEYHLGGVGEWIKAGRIFRIPGNFYTAQPFNAEMLFGLGLLLEGDFWGHAPKLINFGFFCGLIATANLLLRGIGATRALSLGGCLVFAMHPLIIGYSPSTPAFSVPIAAALKIISIQADSARAGIVFAAKNDLALAFFSAVALANLLAWIRTREIMHGVLAGIIAGLAIGCKYTAIGVILIPCAIGLVPLTCEWRDWKSLLKHEALFLGFALLVFSPWTLKNFTHYGNPLYPLLPSLFTNESFTQFQYDFYCNAHGAAPLLSLEYWSAVARRMNHYTLWFWLPLAGIPLLRERRPLAIGLAMTFILGHMACATLTQNPDRFQAPLVAPLTLIGAMVLLRLMELRREWRWGGACYLAAAGLLLMLMLTSSFQLGEIKTGLHGKADDETLERILPGLPWIRESLQPEERLLLVFEARPYFFKQPVECNTVFDRFILLRHLRESRAQDWRSLAASLRQHGFDYVLVNEYELLRMIQFFTPDRMLEEKFSGLPANEIRANLKKTGMNSADLLPLYPPLIFEAVPADEIQILHDFIHEIRKHTLYASNQSHPERPGVWIADLNAESH
ncbi:hypothetical protein JXA32_12975 [Candidatus Sumerlaeota bacterium]|nr:hypothetical protein [Candidatus Sumerlaeota bacterium]